ncbi:MAG: hypothetical protein QXX35_02475 [Desulfurococcaceae archaeon]
MFNLKYLFVILIAFSILLSQIIVENSVRDNYATILSDGSYSLNITYIDLINSDYYFEQYGSYDDYILQYSVKYRPNSIQLEFEKYDETFLIIKTGRSIIGNYSLIFITRNENTVQKVEYTAEETESSIDIDRFTLLINTTNRVRILEINITMLNILLLSKPSDIIIDYIERIEYIWMKIEIKNLYLNSTILTNKYVSKLLCLPHDLNTFILLQPDLLSLRERNWFEDNYLKRECLITGVRIDFITRGDKYVFPLNIPGNYSKDIVIGFKNIVSIDSIKWRVIVENNIVEAFLSINGFGFGLSNEDKIKSVIKNIYDLTEIHGCIKLFTKSFHIVLNNNKYEAIDICRTIDLNNLKIELENKHRNIIEKPGLIYTTMLILIAIVLTIIILFYPILRVRR